jgi:ABC-type oligopeptide transport system ATPase subunit
MTKIWNGKSMTDTLLKVKNLKKEYKSGPFSFFKTPSHTAVNDVSLEIKKGEILGLVGESGCGKSTLAHCITRLIPLTSGEVYFEGSPFHTLKGAAFRRLRLEMQTVFQDPLSSLNPRKTVLENLGDPLIYHKRISSNDQKLSKVQEVLYEIGMPTDIADYYPHQFSGGQQQRLSIGRALILSPKLLICDEAVSALDLSVQAQILNLLSDLQKRRGLSYLFISHDLSVVSHLCDRVIVMKKGNVVEEGTTKALFTEPKHSYTKQLLDSIPYL